MREPTHDLPAAEKKMEESTSLSELFYCSTGITSQGQRVHLSQVRDQIHTRAGRVIVKVFLSLKIICENLLPTGIQPSFREECSEMVGLKVNQSASPPRTTNLAFPRFLLPAGLPEWQTA